MDRLKFWKKSVVQTAVKDESTVDEKMNATRETTQFNFDYDNISTITQISIPAFQITQHVLYQLIITTKGFTYKIYKRFSEFHNFYLLLSERYNLQYECFPKKFELFKTKSQIAKQRKKYLEKFIQEVHYYALQHIDRLQIQEYFDFIELNRCCKKYFTMT